ncbi:MAG TPA: hypothetical protein VN612_17550 [Acidobacteriaceae bacterium]|nr:hypothetical protein [Acidobacteriaceae bacterium]
MTARKLIKFPILVFCFSQAHLSPSQTMRQPSPDPMAIGKQALAKNDFAAARDFFAAYLKDNPDNLEAKFDAGNAALGLRDYDTAAQDFHQVIARNPAMWPAHKNLVIVYAGQGKWTDFDQERAAIQQARLQRSPGLTATDADVVDIIYVGPDRYIAKAFATLNGRFHVRYNIYHLNEEGKADYWIACESDDVDQTFFAKKHPKEAAAGERSFSLDSYTQIVKVGDHLTQTHGTIKFYPDGEPTYETVRADVVSVLEHRTAPISSTTVGPKPSQPQSSRDATPPSAQQ